VAGGWHNTTEGEANDSVIGGGHGNWIGTNALYATIPGGYSNYVAAEHGFAAGCHATSLHQGAFVWGDSTLRDIASTNRNSWTVRASGGVRFFANVNANIGVRLPPNGNAWSSMSDRNLKENFTPVDTRAVLEKVSLLPITEWNLKSQPAEVRHLGPMAQDFMDAFGLGEDECMIGSTDADGVALAAIQGLHQVVREKDAQLQALQRQNQSLEQRLAELERRIDRLSAAPSGAATR
jgi:hypothetical protein